jgi:hypothetical protein
MPYAQALQRFLYCTKSQWLIAVNSGLIVSALSWPWYGSISVWVGVVLFLMTVVVFHGIFTFTLMVPLPHIAILITGLQYVLAAWFSFYYPSNNPMYNIGARLPEYLSFAGWVTAGVCLGWALLFWGLRPSSISTTPVSAALLVELDLLFWIGMVCTIVSHVVSFGPVNFVLVLCTNLRYLGALGRMMVSGLGWKWRICLTLALEVLFSTGAGMFHDLLLWGTSVLAICMYKFKPRKIVFFGCMCLGFMALPALQQAKLQLRERVWSGDSTGVLSLANAENAADLSKNIGSGLMKSATGDWDSDFLGEMAVRFNQGWIINRVMETVPCSEPYAKGATLISAIEASMLPRFLSPNKAQAGGKANMQRYAHYTLGDETSMNLGYAGEMYANFGYWGGIAGCFFYALILALAFRWIFKRAELNPLWWAFVPYVGEIGLKAEVDIAEVLNWIVKATIVSVAIYFTFPAIRAALSAPRGRDQRVMLRQSRFLRQRVYLKQPNFSSHDLGTSKTAIRAGLSESLRGDQRVIRKKWRFFRQRFHVEKDGLSSRDLGTSRTSQCE